MYTPMHSGCRLWEIKIVSVISFLCCWNGFEDYRSQDIIKWSISNKYKFNPISNPCGVVGIDIAQDERERYNDINRRKSFEKLFDKVKKLNINRTIHAGEGLGWYSVTHAINKLHAQRIGHGYRSINNEQCLQLIKNKNIHLECCLTSSVVTNGVKNIHFDDKLWLSHPILTFIKRGISVSLSTDDPLVFGCNMQQEINIARYKLLLSWKQIGNLFINGAKFSFLPNKQKQELIQLITKRVDNWVDQQEKGKENRKGDTQLHLISKL